MRRTLSGRHAWAAAILATAVIAGTLAIIFLANRLPPVPNRPLRIGFESNPPFQIRTEKGYGGIAVETVNEAAKRVGVRLQWVETGTSSDEAFQKGLVDLWPLMTDLPDRRKRLYLSQPWVMSSHILFLRNGSATPDRTFTGRIAVFKLPLHIRLLRDEFPKVQPVPLSDPREVLRAVCNGAATAGFLEKRVAMGAIKDLPSECVPSMLRVQNLDDLTLKNCVASTFEASGAAHLIRREIGSLFRDGSLAVMMAKYSYYGLDDAWATYSLMETAERDRWLAWGAAGLAVVLAIAILQTLSLRQRKRSERVIRDSEERFRALFQQAGVGVAQISLDGKVELANDKYCEVVGHRREGLLGKETVEITPPADLRQQLAMMPRLISGEIQSFSTEKRYQRDDGSIIWAEMCKSLVRDVDGKPRCFIAVVEDITERKQAEAALRESEERFRNMADSAPVLIWVSGRDQLCTFFNKRWLEFTGRSMEQELGNGWAESVHPDDRERCWATYAIAFEAHTHFQMEYRLRRADGEYRYVLDDGVPRFSTDGAFAGYIGTCSDVTELKRNYEHHLATQKLESLGVLAAGVAHDFNNLLGAIVARAESAHSDLESYSSASEDVDHIRVTAMRAAEIVSQLMTYASQETAPSTAIDLSALVAEILDLLKVSIAKTAVLITELAQDLPLIRGNPAEIRQVVMNLIINASEALEGQPGSITITTSAATSIGKEPGVAVRLDVRDTGCGMTDAIKERIFDPFFTTRFVGRGLGLSAVQGIVRRHGGLIEIESAPGQGSRFTVLLPAASEQELGTPAPSSVVWNSGTVKPSGAVLFIEDEDALRSVIARVLRKRDFQVIEAADGAAGIELMKSEPAGIDIVILDVTLPGVSGCELFDELHRIKPETKIILSTAYNRETAMAEFRGRNVWGFLRKPYRTDDLVNLLQRAASEPNASDRL